MIDHELSVSRMAEREARGESAFSSDLVVKLEHPFAYFVESPQPTFPEGGGGSSAAIGADPLNWHCLIPRDDRSGARSGAAGGQEPPIDALKYPL